MASLCFTLSAEQVSRTRDLLVCLSKFNETVDLEATAQTLTLSSLNIAKTSFAAFRLHALDYFESYELSHTASEKFGCSVFNKALFAIFKTRLTDVRDNDTSVEKCEVSVFDGADRTACRIIARLVCRHGVKKTFKLTYEPSETLFPAFDEASSHNTWTINANVLKSFSEHFGSRTEHLDFFRDADRVLLTCYTEKIARGSEILKQPLQTTITIDRLDFDDVNVEEHQHVGINVKDFRAIVAHADTLKVPVTARYSRSAHPMQLVYEDSGLRCEFTLVTMSEYLGTSIKTTSAASASRTSAPPPRAQPPLELTSYEQMRSTSTNGQMSAPPAPSLHPSSRSAAHARLSRPSPPPPQASINQESLFLADDDDDDSRWGERNYQDDTDAVTWDTGGGLLSRNTIRSARNSREAAASAQPEDEPANVPPTQRLSQIRGLFDD